MGEVRYEQERLEDQRAGIWQIQNNSFQRALQVLTLFYATLRGLQYLTRAFGAFICLI
jgi:hypothetical protein